MDGCRVKFQVKFRTMIYINTSRKKNSEQISQFFCLLNSTMVEKEGG